MYNIIKRIVAYIIDFMIVTIFTAALSVTPLNPNYEKTEELNNEYTEKLEYYSDIIANLQEIYAGTSDADIVMDDEYIDAINEALEDGEMTEDEYNDIYDVIFEDYYDYYEEYYYEAKNLSLYESIINMVVIILYIAVFGYFLKGQTLGKKLMKLRVVKSNSDENPSIWSYLIRTVILYNVVFTIIDMVVFKVINYDYYLTFYGGLYIAMYIVEILIVVLACFREDNRGFHDLLAKTRVIETNKVYETTVKEIEDKDK